MSGRSLLFFVLVIGMLALGMYMTVRMLTPQHAPPALAPADTTAPGYQRGAPPGPAVVDQARRDMEKMQEATRKATEKQTAPRNP